MEGLSFTYYWHQARLRITHNHTADTVSINLLDTSINGDVVFKRSGSTNVLTCDQWAIQCDLGNVHGTSTFTVKFLGSGISITIPLLADS